MINEHLCAFQSDSISTGSGDIRVTVDHRGRRVQIWMPPFENVQDADRIVEARIRAITVAMLWTVKYYDVHFCSEVVDFEEAAIRR